MPSYRFKNKHFAKERGTQLINRLPSQKYQEASHLVRVPKVVLDQQMKIVELEAFSSFFPPF
jgi:hypothetical protein